MARRAHGIEQPPPREGGHAVRRIEAESADVRIRERIERLRPPVEQRCGRVLVVEVRIRDVVFVTRVARIEPRLFRLERKKPVAMLAEQMAVGCGTVDHEIDE